MNRPNQQGLQLFCKERVYQVQNFPNQAGKAHRQCCRLIVGLMRLSLEQKQPGVSLEVSLWGSGAPPAGFLLSCSLPSVLVCWHQNLEIMVV